MSPSHKKTQTDIHPFFKWKKSMWILYMIDNRDHTKMQCNNHNKTEDRYKLTTVCSKVWKGTFTESISRGSALIWLLPWKGKPFREALQHTKWRGKKRGETHLLDILIHVASVAVQIPDPTGSSSLQALPFTFHLNCSNLMHRESPECFKGIGIHIKFESGHKLSLNLICFWEA